MAHALLRAKDGLQLSEEVTEFLESQPLVTSKTLEQMSQVYCVDSAVSQYLEDLVKLHGAQLEQRAETETMAAGELGLRYADSQFPGEFIDEVRNRIKNVQKETSLRTIKRTKPKKKAFDVECQAGADEIDSTIQRFIELKEVTIQN